MDRIISGNGIAAIAVALVLIAYTGGCLCCGGNNESTSTTIKETTTHRTDRTTTTTHATTTRLRTTTTALATTTRQDTAPTTTTATTTTTAAQSTTNSTTTTTSSTTTTTTSPQACSGDAKGDMKLYEGDEDYGELYLSFTGDDGRRYEKVGLFQGPYSKGDKFMLGGKAYQYTEYSMKDHSGACNTLFAYFKNLIDANTDKLTLNAYTGPAITLSTSPFTDAAGSSETLEVEPDENCNDTYVFLLRDVEGVQGVSLLYDGGDIYFVSSYANGTVPNQDIGVWGRSSASSAGQTGTPFKRLYESGGKFSIYAINEGGDDANFDGDTDDALIILKDGHGEVAVMDFYDKNHDHSQGYYSTSVKATEEGNWNDNSGILSESGIDATLDNEDDTLLILPESGFFINADYGTKRRILDLRMCPSIH
ncbi:MAG: hypothetical protein PHG85_01675 [Candidatus Altiarchaeota archaeon]|nr:hypothetical protein [Candidatus Altiarchaeota archaeon]